MIKGQVNQFRIRRLFSGVYDCGGANAYLPSYVIITLRGVKCLSEKRTNVLEIGEELMSRLHEDQFQDNLGQIE